MISLDSFDAGITFQRFFAVFVLARLRNSRGLGNGILQFYEFRS